MQYELLIPQIRNIREGVLEMRNKLGDFRVELECIPSEVHVGVVDELLLAEFGHALQE
jgi:hypothetical protein